MKRARAVGRRRAFHLLEVLCFATAVFSLYFLVPLGLGCTPCPNAPNATETLGGSDATDRRRLAAAPPAGGGCVYSGHRPHVRHHCADGRYSELATLLLSGQEAMLNHLLSRHDTGDGDAHGDVGGAQELGARAEAHAGELRRPVVVLEDRHDRRDHRLAVREAGRRRVVPEGREGAVGHAYRQILYRQLSVCSCRLTPVKPRSYS